MTATIRRGSTGGDVTSWQRVLVAGSKPDTWRNARGMARSWPASWTWPIGIDGGFGERTEAATEAWQAARGLEADGVVGPKTWSVATGVEVVAPPPLLYGTDISAIQGAIDAKTWDALDNLGIRFAIMRAIVGNETWIDSYGANLRAAADRGIVGGLYLFGYPLRHIDPVKQAEDWFRRVEKFGSVAGEMPLALDAEWPPREEWKKNPDGTKTLTYPWRDKWKLDAPFIRTWFLRCAQRLEALSGCPPLLYTYRYFWQCIEGAAIPEFGRFPLWLADYGFAGRWPTPLEVAKLKALGPWAEPTIVQHDGDGGMKLPNGRDADFNIMTGGESRLAALLGPRSEATPIPELAVAALRPSLLTLTDDAIAAYRRDRIREEPQAA